MNNVIGNGLSVKSWPEEFGQNRNSLQDDPLSVWDENCKAVQNKVLQKRRINAHRTAQSSITSVCVRQYYTNINYLLDCGYT